MQTISFYSYKGGVGRTLVVANVARYLTQFGQKVVALDFDLEAPGLHYKFSLGRDDDPLDIKRGILDYIHTFVVEGQAPGSIEDFVTPVPISEEGEETLQLIAAGAAPSAEYWEKLSKISWHELLYDSGGRGIRFFLEMKQRIEEELKPDFLLVDSRTGITEIGGVATTILPDVLVCLLLNNRENLEGARAVLRSLLTAPRPPERSPPRIVPVLSRIPVGEDNNDMEKEILQEVREFLGEPAESLETTLNVEDLFVLHSEPELQVKERLHIGPATRADESTLLWDYLKLFARVFPVDAFEPHIMKLADRAKLRAYEDREEAYRVLERLASRGHPAASRAFLEFLLTFNVNSWKALVTAKQLYELSGNADDPILAQAVDTCLTGIAPNRVDSALAEFAAAIWRHTGSDNVPVGLRLSDCYDNLEKKDLAIDVLLELVDRVGPNEGAVVNCITKLGRAGRMREAYAIIRRFAMGLMHSTAFLAAWLNLALAAKTSKIAVWLLDGPSLDRVMELDAPKTFELLIKMEREDDMENYLRHLLSGGFSSELLEVASLFKKRGKYAFFERVVTDTQSPGTAEEILSRLKARFE